MGFETKKCMVMGTDSLLISAKRLMDQGDITPEQYAEMVERNRKLSPEMKTNKTIINVVE